MPPKPIYKELELRNKNLEQEVHAHQETREQLRRNEELFRDLTETLPIPAVIGTTGLETLYLNPKFTEVFGFTAEDLPDQQAWRDKFFKDTGYLAKISQEVNDWIESGAKSTVFHRHYLDKWGNPHEVVVHIFRLKDRYYNFIEDVTETKRSEESLKRNYNVLEQMVAERTEDLLQSNLRLRREIEERERAEKVLKFTQFAVDHVSDAAFWLEPDGRIIYINKAACRALGYSKEELLELNVHDIDPDFPKDVWSDHWKNIKQRALSTIESNHRTKDGKIFPVEIRTVPMTKEGLCLSLAQLTAQLLAYARGGKYKARTISLNSFVRDTLPLLNHTLKPKVIVETDLPFDVLDVEADLTQLQMILSALLQYASEAIEDRGRIRIICRNENIQPGDAKNLPGLIPGLYVSLTIRDDGKGMDEETRNRAFEPFFTRKFQGRGLGLAAVYGIVKNHNGWISIDSQLGSGTTVKIYFPAKFEDKKQQLRTTHLSNESGTILLIEDEEHVLAVNQAFIQKPFTLKTLSNKLKEVGTISKHDKSG